MVDPWLATMGFKEQDEGIIGVLAGQGPRRLPEVLCHYFNSTNTTGPPKYGGTMPPDVAKFLADNFLPPTPSAPRKNKASLK